MVDNSSPAGQNWARYTYIRDNGHSRYIEEAKKFDSFYYGQQWDKADIDKLAAVGRPALTINTILSTINVVLGEQANQRGDVTYRPKGNGTAEVADALSKVTRQIADNNRYDFLESQVFADGLIQDRGFFDVRIGFDDHMKGEVRIKALDPLDVLIDPDAREYDPATWSDVLVTRWLTLDEIESLYGKSKAAQVKALGSSYGEDSIRLRPDVFGEPQLFDATDTSRIRRVRVIERQHKRIASVRYFVDPVMGDMRVVPESWDEAQVQVFAAKTGLQFITRHEPRIRWTVSADDVLLHDDWSKYKFFTVVPYFPYFRRGKPFGMVRNLISPQELLNKASSQELHIINTSANSGWILEDGALQNMQPEELENRGAETGLVLVTNPGANPPEKIKPNPIPTGIDNVSRKALANIKEISGVSDSLSGFDGAEVSGVAIQAKQSRGLVQIQVPLDHLALTRELVAERILCLIQQYYTEERILHVADYSQPGQPSQELAINQYDNVSGQILNDLTLGEYSVVVTTTPARDNFEESQYAEAIELRNVGVAIPDDAIVEYSHLARKRELAERIRALHEGAQPTPEQEQMQAQLQQLQMQQMQLALQKLQAEIQSLQSTAQLSVAKAEDLLKDDNQQTEMRNKYQMNQENNETKVNVESMRVEALLEQARIRAEASLEQARMQAHQQRELAKQQKTTTTNQGEQYE